MTKKNIFQSVYRLVRKIPEGRVTTYGAIAKKLGTTDARVVGWALHANSDTKTPCHRVVNRRGELAESYAFGGWQKQKEVLQKEGVGFVGEKKIDLKNFSFDINSVA